ncbi:hypothetical protein O0L34_g17446 [Tuta absoluta]|nr:hypothetical protein O0L34_g17446 [Tuta absoluta]
MKVLIVLVSLALGSMGLRTTNLKKKSSKSQKSFNDDFLAIPKNYIEDSFFDDDISSKSDEKAFVSDEDSPGTSDLTNKCFEIYYEVYRKCVKKYSPARCIHGQSKLLSDCLTGGYGDVDYNITTKTPKAKKTRKPKPTATKKPKIKKTRKPKLSKTKKPKTKRTRRRKTTTEAPSDEWSEKSNEEKDENDTATTNEPKQDYTTTEAPSHYDDLYAGDKDTDEGDLDVKDDCGRTQLS